MDKTQEAARPAPMVVAAARELCKRASEACNVDFEDNWKIYGGDFIADAEAALKAAGALELLEALRDMVSDHADLSDKTLAFARAAIAKATGAAAPAAPSLALTAFIQDVEAAEGKASGAAA